MSAAKQLLVARLGQVEYLAALRLQTAMVEARLKADAPDTLLILEHPHVLTLGRGADASYIVRPRPDVPVHRVSRGGQVTYHGPGQLVGYPILTLKGRARDVGGYIRRLEQAMIDALAERGIIAGRRPGLAGVWFGRRKIGSVGVGFRRWISFHGFALNVNCDLSYFDAIVPCGINDCEMVSIASLGHPEVTVRSFAETMARSFARVFGYETTALIAADELWRMAVQSELGREAEA